MHKRTIGLVVGSVAALVLLGGTAADAGGLFTGKNVKDSSLTGKDIKDGSLTLKDFKASERAKLRGPAGANGVAATLNTIIVESPTVTVPAFDIGSVDATCPAGTKVTGGGYFSSIAIPAASAPAQGVSTTTWRLIANNSDNPLAVEINAYAVCA